MCEQLSKAQMVEWDKTHWYSYVYLMSVWHDDVCSANPSLKYLFIVC